MNFGLGSNWGEGTFWTRVELGLGCTLGKGNIEIRVKVNFG